jgi:hypothetical protein
MPEENQTRMSFLWGTVFLFPYQELFETRNHGNMIIDKSDFFVVTADEDCVLNLSSPHPLKPTLRLGHLSA